MKVILLENVRKIGSIGEIIDVKRGFARNFLISKKKLYLRLRKILKKLKKLNKILIKKIRIKKKSLNQSLKKLIINSMKLRN